MGGDLGDLATLRNITMIAAADENHTAPGTSAISDNVIRQIGQHGIDLDSMSRSDLARLFTAIRVNAPVGMTNRKGGPNYLGDNVVHAPGQPRPYDPLAFGNEEETIGDYAIFRSNLVAEPGTGRLLPLVLGLALRRRSRPVRGRRACAVREIDSGPGGTAPGIACRSDSPAPGLPRPCLGRGAGTRRSRGVRITARGLDVGNQRPGPRLFGRCTRQAQRPLRSLQGLLLVTAPVMGVGELSPQVGVLRRELHGTLEGGLGAIPIVTAGCLHGGGEQARCRGVTWHRCLGGLRQRQLLTLRDLVRQRFGSRPWSIGQGPYAGHQGRRRGRRSRWRRNSRRRRLAP